MLTSSYWPADTSQPVWRMTAGDALRRSASLAGECTALVEIMPQGMSSLTGANSTNRRWTYTQLLADAEACAGLLLSKFDPGTSICLWAPNVPEWVIIQYGAALAGMVLVTANPSLRSEELDHILDRSGARALFHVDAFRGTDMAALAEKVGGACLQRLRIHNFDAALEPFRGEISLPEVAFDAPAQLQFTSGTTGHPKGALLHHYGLVTNAAFVGARTREDGDVIVTPMPLFHTAGSVLSVLTSAVSLSTLVLPVMFDPALMLDTIESEKATKTSGVPTMLAAMIDEQAARPRDLSTLRVIASGGSPVAPELLARAERAFGCPLVSVYGQTELSPVVCATDIADEVEDRASTSGRPLPQVEIRIAEPLTGETLPIGQEGEIQARGYQTMLEYIGEPDATAATLLADGWLRTGDLGTMDSRGFVRVTGRLSDMIIRGGENIYPAEIEAALLRHAAVAEVAVFGIPDEYWGETVAAALRFKTGFAHPAADEMKRHCRSLLSPQKTPARWYVVEAFPMTSSGKIKKFALAEQFGDPLQPVEPDTAASEQGISR